MSHLFAALVGLAAMVAGAIASISGFGIGSILTPLLATAYGTKLAVAVVSVPHLVGTALRFSFIYRHVNRKVLFSFGIAQEVCSILVRRKAVKDRRNRGEAAQ